MINYFILDDFIITIFPFNIFPYYNFSFQLFPLFQFFPNFNCFLLISTWRIFWKLSLEAVKSPRKVKIRHPCPRNPPPPPLPPTPLESFLSASLSGIYGWRLRKSGDEWLVTSNWWQVIGDSWKEGKQNRYVTDDPDVKWKMKKIEENRMPNVTTYRYNENIRWGTKIDFSPNRLPDLVI